MKLSTYFKNVLSDFLNVLFIRMNTNSMEVTRALTVRMREQVRARRRRGQLQRLARERAQAQCAGARLALPAPLPARRAAPRRAARARRARRHAERGVRADLVQVICTDTTRPLFEPFILLFKKKQILVTAVIKLVF